jgi:O-antigen/teichoic acid export membrane protein
LAVQAGTLLLVARMLGPHEFGAFAGISALAVILGTLSTFGTHLVLLGEVSKEALRREAILRYAIPTTLLCGGGLLAIYMLVCTFALGETGVAPHVLLALGIAETLLQPLIVLCGSEHHGLGRIARAQLLTILPLALRLVAAATVIGLRLADPLGAYAYGYGLASLAALVLVLPTLPAPWPAFARWRLPRRTELRHAVGFAAINITKAGPAELDKTLAIKLLPLTSAGVYAVAARVVGAIMLPVTAMTMAALPRLFREGRDQPHRTRNLLRWMFGTAFGYSVVLAGLLWLVAPVFDWVFGARYHDVVDVVRWLCLAIPGMALRLTAGNVLMALGKLWMRVGFEAFGLLVLVTASAVLTSRLGTIGMPLSLACSEWGMAAVGGTLLVQLRLHSGDRRTLA